VIRYRLQLDERLFVIHVLCIVACLERSTVGAPIGPRFWRALGRRSVLRLHTSPNKTLPFDSSKPHTLPPSPSANPSGQQPYPVSVTGNSTSTRNPHLKVARPRLRSTATFACRHRRSNPSSPQSPQRQLRYMYSRQIHAFRVEPPPKLQDFRCMRIPRSLHHSTNG
jgi:hypothetical protein